MGVYFKDLALYQRPKPYFLFEKWIWIIIIKIISHFFLPLGEEAPVPTKTDAIKPTFTERPVIRQSDDEPNKIIFECRLVGEPRPEITWFHNEKQIGKCINKVVV